MSSIAVTGATGHLGRRLVNRVVQAGHTVIPIGRTWDASLEADVLLHLAAPDHRDETAIAAFGDVNERICAWSQVTGTRVINTGTWWQYAGPEAESLSYTRLKVHQQALFDTTLVLFSVYGGTTRTGRGFIPQLVDYCRGRGSLAGVSRQPRDWIHVDDVIDAYMATLEAPAGVYEVCTGESWSPLDLVQQMAGTSLPDYPEYPSCTPVHLNPLVPGWRPRIGVRTYLQVRLAEAA